MQSWKVAYSGSYSDRVWSGSPQKNTQSHAIRRIAVGLPMNSSNKIGSVPLTKVTDVSHTTELTFSQLIWLELLPRETKTHHTSWIGLLNRRTKCHFQTNLPFCSSPHRITMFGGQLKKDVIWYTMQTTKHAPRVMMCSTIDQWNRKAKGILICWKASWSCTWLYISARISCRMVCLAIYARLWQFLKKNIKVLDWNSRGGLKLLAMTVYLQ